MIISVHQPQYLPWLGFFHKLSNSDAYVSLDTVQYMNRGFIHRNKIKTPQGWVWLTIPVMYEHGNIINEVRIKYNTDWVDKHLNSLEHNYSKAPFFKDYFNNIEKIYRGKWELLSSFDEALLSWTIKELGIKVKYLKLSEIEAIGSDSTLRIINICKKIGADTYLSGSGGTRYMDENLFKKEGIKLSYQKFEHPIYKQRFGDFIQGLSIIDLLFNYGKESLKIILGDELVSTIN